MTGLLLALLLAQADPPAATPVLAPGEAAVVLETRPRPDRRLLDLSADALKAGEWQLHVLPVRYLRGLFPWLRIGFDFLWYLLSVVNVSLNAQVLDLPALRLSVEASVYWLAAGPLLSQSLGPTGYLNVPAQVRATVPLADDWDFSVAGKYAYTDLRLQALPNLSAFRGHSVGLEAVLIRHDASGAFFLLGQVPLGLWSTTRPVDGFGLGLVGVDTLASWGVLVGRDQRFGPTGHLRVGVGYRHTPGLLFFESYGPVLLQLDFYWR